MSFSVFGTYVQTVALRILKQFLLVIVSPMAHVVILVIGLSLVTWGSSQLVMASQQQPRECPACPAHESFRCLVGEQANPQVNSIATTVTIDIAGAVKRPGIYDLPIGARLSDAIDRAGGLSSEADLAVIAKSLNLATLLSPDSKVYIPTINDDVTAIPTISLSAGKSESVGSELVDINTASQSELEELPAIGAVTAAKIIAGRPYTQIEELLTKTIITETTFNKLQLLIVAN